MCQICILLNDINLSFLFLASEAIIYNKSCQLHKYCLDRDPTIFKERTFVVERFHWENHKGNLTITHRQSCNFPEKGSPKR